MTTPKKTSPSRRSALRGVLFVVLCTAANSSCSGVAFYEKEQFADTLMQLGDSATESHFCAKIFYSREASVGGIGSSAGGGCGCGN